MKNIFRKAFSLLIVASLTLGLTIAASAADEKESLTRADAVGAVYELAGSPVVDIQIPFDDVTDVPAVAWAVESGITNGCGNNKFMPEAKITVQDFAVMLFRYAAFVANGELAVESKSGYEKYEDAAAVADYARDAVNWATTKGILAVEAKIEPDAALTGADMDAMLAQFAEVKGDGDPNYYLFATAWGTKGGVTDVQSFEYDVENQQLNYIGRFGGYKSMSVLAQDGDLLFVGMETKTEGEDLLFSYRILPNGALKELDSEHTIGLAICDLDVDPVNNEIFALNFESRTMAMLTYDEEGNLTRTDTYEFTDPGSYEIGYGPTDRQDAAYPHGAKVMPDGNHLSVCNMGADKIYVFEIDHENDKLTLCPEKTLTIDGGEGARHLEFSEDGKLAYMNTEMGCTVYVLAVNEDSTFTVLQKLSTLDPTKENPTKGWCSVVILSKDGKNAYVANRGQNNIAAYAIGEDGLLTLIGFYDCYGNSPRGMSFGYNDEVIIVSCNTSGTISVVERDPATGALGECLQVIEDIPGSAHVKWSLYSE